MKALVGIFSGFVVSLSIFAAGAALAVYFVAVPEGERGLVSNVAYNWPLEPQVVARANPPAPGAPKSSPVSAGDFESADATTTNSVAEGNPQDDELTLALQDHVAWCAQRYRSYRLSDNMYTPYRGGRRPCISPYYNEVMAAGELVERGVPSDGGDLEYVVDSSDDARDQATLQYAVNDGMDPDHISFCLSRYRSYREEDNTYQPYGGGPRRQCLAD